MGKEDCAHPPSWLYLPQHGLDILTVAKTTGGEGALFGGNNGWPLEFAVLKRPPANNVEFPGQIGNENCLPS